MNYFLKKKKWLAWVIMLTFLFTSFMPSNIMAGNSVAEAAVVGDANLSQIVSNGETIKYYGTGLATPGNPVSANKVIDDTEPWQASTSKTIATVKDEEGNTIENEFDITLQVQTSENLDTYEIKQDAAVVLVLDYSGSMDSKEWVQEDNKWVQRTRLNLAVNAANQFISEYRENMSGAAYLSVVTFDKTANVYKTWADVKLDSSYKITEDDLLNGSGTNIRAGLQTAEVQLKNGTVQVNGSSVNISSIKNQYVILLTDGEPRHGAGEIDGIKYTNKTAAEYYADSIKASNIKLYTIGYGEAGQDWLKNEIASSGCHFQAKTGADLTAIFKKIYGDIKLLTSAWTVTDPMAEHITCLGMYDDKNKYKEGESFSLNRPGDADKGEDATVVYSSFKNNTINWNLLDTPVTGSGTAEDPYTYTMNYRVRLDNTFDVFKEYVANTGDGKYQTNGTTTLVYAIKEDSNSQALKYGPFTVDFKVPSVNGFLAHQNGKTDIKFVKIDGTTQKPIKDVRFTLTFAEDDSKNHKHDSKSLFAGAGTLVTSDKDGKFEFTNIPSGHTYTLTETNAPEGYVTGGPWTVKVDYKNVTITDNKDNSVVTINTDEKSDYKGKFVITNSKGKGNIQFNKTDDRGNALAGATFGLYTDEKCTKAVQKNDGTAFTATSADENGKVTFSNVEVGTYYIKELGADEDGFITIGTGENGRTFKVDEAVYKVEVKNGKTTTKLEKVPSKNDKKGGCGEPTVTKIKNTEYVKISGEKTWVDGNDAGRPSKITVQLSNNKNGKVETKDVTAGSNGKWEYSFMAPKYAGNDEITYTVKETEVGNVAVGDNGYVTDGQNNNLYQVTYDNNNITNTKLTTVSGSKIWQNSDSEDSWPKGAEVTVGLYYQDGDKKLVAVNDSNGQSLQDTLISAGDTFTFADLPQYDENGEIIYVVKEESVTIGETKYDVTDGKITIGSGDNAVVYTVSNGTGSNGYNITNTLAGDADVIITKTWGTVNGLVNEHFDSISVKITGTTGTGTDAETVDYNYTIKKGENWTVTDSKNVTLAFDTDYTATINDNGDWKIKFLKLPVANGSGVKYTYTVAETAINGVAVNAGKANGYTVSVGSNNDPLHITNTPETATLKIEKNWNGVEDENIPSGNVIFAIVGEVGNGSGKTTVINTSATVNVTGKWETLITLPKQWQGEAITYTVGETNIPEGYEVSYQVNDKDATAEKVTWTPAGSDKSQSLWGAVIDWITGQPSAVTGETCTVIATNTLQTAGIQFTKSYSGGVLEGSKGNESEANFCRVYFSS